MSVAPDPEPGVRCARCLGPVHASGREHVCVLCGVVETIAPAAIGKRDCGAGCVYGWDEDRRATCRACGGTGLEVADTR